MAVTKIHPIKSTLNKAVDYICNGDKTDNEIYVSTYLCSRENAPKEFEQTKREFGSRTKTLAHHLIQSFVPEEVSFEEAHQVGKELCDKILEGKYEYILATHIDKDHIHNHIIFNSVDVEQGKVYHSYYGSYMNIRNQSDRLCREHNLSVIDAETQREIDEIKQRKFTSWYDWSEDKKGGSYKSRLQFDIDRVIKQSLNWQDFLSRMQSAGYEIKHGKHIAFRGKEQQRFTRAKTIGVNYTEEKIKDRIANKEKEIGQIIDIKSSKKAKESKGYENWAAKHNLKTAASTVVEMRNQGFKSLSELQAEMSRISFQKNEDIKAFNKLGFEQKRLKEVVEPLKVCINKREHYEGYKKNPNDKIYKMMNKKDIAAYEKAFEEVEVFLKQFPHLKAEILKGIKRGNGSDLFKALNLQSKNLLAEQTKLAQKVNDLQAKYDDLEKLEKNMKAYLKKEDEPKKSVLKQIEKTKTLGVGKIEKRNKQNDIEI